MTAEKIDVVAELLAKIGGTWHPERAGLTGKTATGRQRDVARLILAELERIRARNEAASSSDNSAPETVGEGAVPASTREEGLHVGATVEYSPPGDRRTIICRIEKLDRNRAYLISVGQEVGWVSTHTFLRLKS